ncbi:MAG: metallophosphoesterase family protein [Candidatus Latescibacterota bacterium]|jgi:predicted phosphodiesterase
MRVVLVADVHGNAPALEAVVADARAHGYDRLVAAGDFAGGVANDEVVELLADLGALTVRGNSEGYLLDLRRGTAPAAWRTHRQWAALRWGFDHMSRSSLDFLAAQPERRALRLDGRPAVLVVHGSPAGMMDGLYPERQPGRVEQILAGLDESVLVCGHTHRPWVERHGGRLALNPGSAGSSCNGDPRAHYALLSWDGRSWQVEPRAVDYDRDQTRRRFEARGYLAEGGGFARAALLCTLTGHPVALHLVQHARATAAEAGLAGGREVPDEVWDRAVASFPWETWERMAEECRHQSGLERGGGGGQAATAEAAHHDGLPA